MKKDVELYEKIEAYLVGKLSEQERQSFDEQLKLNSDLRVEVAKHRKLLNLISNKALVDIKYTLQDIHKNKITAPKKNNLNNTGLIIGAAIIVSITAILYFNKDTEPKVTTHQQLKKHEPIEFTDSISIIDTNTEFTNTANVIAVKTIQENKNTLSFYEKAKDSATNEFIDTINTKVAYTKAKVDTAKTPSEILISTSEIDTIKENQDIKPPTTNNQKKKLNNCDEIEITAEITTESSCDNKPTGSIIVISESINGGSSPYFISLDKKQQFTNALQINNLYAKIYNLFIKDINGCISDLGIVTLDNKNCSYEYAFAPDKGEKWHIPTKETTGNIIIFNKYGVLVYEQVFDNPGSYFWHGNAGNGNYLPMGAYMFVLELTDEENLLGTVTIIR